jgi:epoxyqueuosine reductase
MVRIVDKNLINTFLPDKFKKYCLIGICDPKYLDGLKTVYSIKNKKWSASPREIFPNVRSIIVLLHFTPVSNDYSVQKIILALALSLWKKLKLKTHVINKAGKIDPHSLVGTKVGPSARRYKKLIILKDLAYYAGLGQYGKNSLIINPRFGSDFKIQVLFTERNMKYDSPLFSKKYPGCEGCNQCIKLCPSGALNNYKIDPLKCYVWVETVMRSPVSPKLPTFYRFLIKKPKGNYINNSCCRMCQYFCKVNKHHYFKNWYRVILRINSLKNKCRKSSNLVSRDFVLQQCNISSIDL